MTTDIKQDMRLAALDAWRLDGLPATLDGLRDRYGFSAGAVAAHGPAALRWARRRHLADRAAEAVTARTHAAGAGAGGAMPRARVTTALLVALATLAAAVLLPGEARAGGGRGDLPPIFTVPARGGWHLSLRWQDVDRPGGVKHETLAPAAGIAIPGPHRTLLWLRGRLVQVTDPVWHGAGAEIEIGIGGRF